MSILMYTLKKRENLIILPGTVIEISSSERLLLLRFCIDSTILFYTRLLVWETTSKMTQYDDLFNVRHTLYRDGGNAHSNKTILGRAA